MRVLTKTCAAPLHAREHGQHVASCVAVAAPHHRCSRAHEEVLHARGDRMCHMQLRLLAAKRAKLQCEPLLPRQWLCDRRWRHPQASYAEGGQAVMEQQQAVALQMQQQHLAVAP